MISDDRLIFFQNMVAKTDENAPCENNSENWDLKYWCMTRSFRTLSLSSNNPDFFITRKGFVVCKNHSDYNLIQAYVGFNVKYFG